MFLTMLDKEASSESSQTSKKDFFVKIVVSRINIVGKKLHLGFDCFQNATPRQASLKANLHTLRKIP